VSKKGPVSKRSFTPYIFVQFFEANVYRKENGRNGKINIKRIKKLIFKFIL